MATDETYNPSNGTSLVGKKTSNGHVIVDNDYFCALPYDGIVNSSDEVTTNNVTVYYGEYEQASVPVWDLGPQNFHDDYWEVDNVREIYDHLHYGGQFGLGQYVPERTAAFYSNYNQGFTGDMVSSDVNEPNGVTATAPGSGIDLADGVFRDGLGMTNNDYVEVVFNWQSTNSVVTENVKQSEDWFGNVEVESNVDDGTNYIHITNKQVVDIVEGSI